MIYVNKVDISEDTFVKLLESTCGGIIKKFNGPMPNGMNGNLFEDEVYSQMVISSKGSQFEGHIEQTGAHTFPDIIARKLYGTEVKMTVGDKWISTGNSVLETTRVKDVETIYMFFGKFGRKFDAKYRKYQECLYDVGVTHSPRYKINMELAAEESIFKKMGVDYNAFRLEENPIKRLKEYYRKQLKEGEELWWIDSGIEERTVSPVIKTFSTLDRDTKNRFINESLILFPEIFGNSQVKFERAAAYLVTAYNSVSSHLRDSYTAGGRMVITVGDKTLLVSRLIYNLYERAKDIGLILATIPHELLSYYWGRPIVKDPSEMWKELIADKSTEDVNIISVFEAGLNHG